MFPSRYDPAGPHGRHESLKPGGPRRFQPGDTPERPNFTTPTKNSRRPGFSSPIGAYPPKAGSDKRSRTPEGEGPVSSGELSDTRPASTVATSASTMWYDVNGTAPDFSQRVRLPELPPISEERPVAAATSPGPERSGVTGTGEERPGGFTPLGGGSSRSGPSSSTATLGKPNTERLDGRTVTPSSPAVLVTTATREAAMSVSDLQAGEMGRLRAWVEAEVERVRSGESEVMAEAQAGFERLLITGHQTLPTTSPPQRPTRRISFPFRG